MESELAIALLVFLRVLPLGVALAAFSDGFVPAPIALSLTVALAAVLAPHALSEDVTLGWLACLRELSIGATFAFALALALHAAAWAVQLSSVADGLSELRRRMSVPYALCAGYLVLSLRGPEVVVAGLAESLRYAPVGVTSFAGESFATGIAGLVGTALATALGFALPLIVSVWLATMLIALLGRALLPPTLAPLPAVGAMLFTLLAALLLVPIVARTPEAVRAALDAAHALTRSFAR
jgi:flagellar biosynthesis protein FliR